MVSVTFVLYDPDRVALYRESVAPLISAPSFRHW